ncbi:hypothetical protein C8R45DRAFT_942698 [Mycena sanguinolenta]|nr:hypothetical protein C8R45DRAFT_942698 [Mycena sanguinolenta]
MSDAPNFRPEILRSASYWRDFQRRRARIADCAQRELAPGEVHLSAGAVTSQPPIITFIPNRDVPVYGLVQNNGTLARSYDPNCIQPVAPPPRGGGPAINKLPARCDPPPCPGSLEDHRRRAARKYLTKGPSEDEKLLQRLTLGSRASKSASSQSPSSQTHPIINDLHERELPYPHPSRKKRTSASAPWVVGGKSDGMRSREHKRHID